MDFASGLQIYFKTLSKIQLPIMNIQKTSWVVVNRVNNEAQDYYYLTLLSFD